MSSIHHHDDQYEISSSTTRLESNCSSVEGNLINRLSTTNSTKCGNGITLSSSTTVGKKSTITTVLSSNGINKAIRQTTINSSTTTAAATSYVESTTNLKQIHVNGNCINSSPLSNGNISSSSNLNPELPITKAHSLRNGNCLNVQEKSNTSTTSTTNILTETEKLIENSTTIKNIFTVILASISVGMAAIGITSAKDWLSFLVISAQLGAILLLLLAIYNYRIFYIIYKTAFRDLKGGYRYAKVLISVTLAQRSNATVHSIFSKNVKKHPNKICFYFEDEEWTFKQVDELSNQIGNYFTKQGLEKGDSVSLFMENRPEYVCIWLGLCKIGVVPALINFHLRLQPLKHSIEVAKSKALIYGHELTSAVTDILNLGGMDALPLYCSGHSKEDTLLKNALDLDSGLRLAPTLVPIPSEPVNFTDKLLYIFTSGTTGLPKAAVIKHSRYIFAATACHYMSGIRDDVIYAPFPIYHTVGIGLGIGQGLIFGCQVVIRKKFSATNFWKDCVRYNVTAAQYIGEICRYLLTQPPSPDDTKHKVRLMFGNGLRPAIWQEFTKRFNIKIISEFYGATEGNCNIINIDNHVGAVGFISRIFPFVYPVTLIKVDEITGEPIRDHKTGLVLRCRPNEDGELVGRIVENHPVREFQGYADSTATNKKIVRDVFHKGDAAFRTGDILMMDEFGYFYFKDRTGDTYRWKGENVSTSEVEAAVSNSCDLKDAVVYGVEIPGSEGRAGMASILDPEGTLDLTVFVQNLSKNLPAYARPLFVRVVKQIDMTGTYKMKKIDLQKEGFDVTRVSDKIYFLTKNKYVPVDNELYSKLMSGQMRL